MKRTIFVGKFVRFKLYVALIAIVLPASQGHGETTGNNLLTLCESKEPELVLACSTYINGALGGQRSGAISSFLKLKILLSYQVSASTLKEIQSLNISDLLGYCMPENVTGDQISDLFVKYLRDHPETRQKHASTLLLDALMDAFPCGG